MTDHPEKPVPTYRRHKQSGQAVVTLTDGLGGRKDVLLGKHGTKDSRIEYARVIAQWEAAGRRFITAATAADLTINEVMLAYWQHVQDYYRHADGTPTSEVNNIRAALRTLKQLYGLTPAAQFDTLGLETVRQQMIRDGRCRNLINKDVARIKRLFKWAGAKKLAPSAVYQDLCCIDGLRAGRSKAKETAPVLPVPRAIVEETLTVLRPTLADMVQLQLETGMRPGELCAMRAIDIDMTGPVWLYRPGRHKTEHHGHTRVVPIGPKAQELTSSRRPTAWPSSARSSGLAANPRFSPRNRTGAGASPSANQAIATPSRPTPRPWPMRATGLSRRPNIFGRASRRTANWRRAGSTAAV
jgi:integrase